MQKILIAFFLLASVLPQNLVKFRDVNYKTQSDQFNVLIAVYLNCSPHKCTVRVVVDDQINDSDKKRRSFIISSFVKKYANISLSYSNQTDIYSIDYAIESGVDYVLATTSSVLFSNENLIADCIRHQKPIVAPMFRSVKPSLTSNFGTFDMYNEQAPNSYMDIIDKKKIGCFLVETVGVPLFLNVKFVRKYAIELKYGSLISNDKFNVYVCNREENGWIVKYARLYAEDAELICDGFNHLLTEYQLMGPNKTYIALPTEINELKKLRKGTKINVNKTYVINLERRPDRLDRIKSALDLLQIDSQVWKAVDGYELTRDDLNKKRIKTLEKFIDPYNKRTVNMGEVACFLSHYNVWEDARLKEFDIIMVLEDDARFDFLFAYNLNRTVSMLKEKNLDWDMIYLGRKIMENGETFLSNIPTLVEPLYSHWTIGYVLSKSGIKKLLDQKPLERLIPVDEYLPLMFDQHPNLELKKYFPVRNLKTFAFQPSIIQPTHYYGEASYVSDTENTTIV